MTDNINKNIENEELDLEKLNGVSGGYIIHKPYPDDEPYKIYDNDGQVIGTFQSLEEAREAAKKMGLADKLARIDKKLGGGRMG